MSGTSWWLVQNLHCFDDAVRDFKYQCMICSSTSNFAEHLKVRDKTNLRQAGATIAEKMLSPWVESYMIDAMR